MSQFAGAAEQLRSALIVNPYDVDNVVDALNKALHMPLPERVERWREMMGTVSRDNVAAWRDSFVEALVKVPLATA